MDEKKDTWERQDAARRSGRPRVAKEPKPRSHPGGGSGAGTSGGGTGDVPEGGAVGPGPAVADD